MDVRAKGICREKFPYDIAPSIGRGDALNEAEKQAALRPPVNSNERPGTSHNHFRQSRRHLLKTPDHRQLGRGGWKKYVGKSYVLYTSRTGAMSSLAWQFNFVHPPAHLQRAAASRR